MSISKKKEHTGKTLNSVEIAWGIFWMVAGGMLFISSELFADLTVWAGDSLAASIVIFIVIFAIMSVLWTVAIKIASYAKPRLVKMFLHDVDVIRENNQIEEARKE